MTGIDLLKAFLHGCNFERPCKASLYGTAGRALPAVTSALFTRAGRGIPHPRPRHLSVGSRRICFSARKTRLGRAFASQQAGVKEEEIRRVSLASYEIGYFDLDTCRLEPVDNPFGARVLTMSPV